MAKQAITYYYHPMRGVLIDVVIHNSGKEAVDYLVKNCGRYFTPKPIWKNKPKLTGKGAVTAGFPHRKMVARFLNDEEMAIYQKFGDETRVDYKTQALIEPPVSNTTK